MLKRYTLGALSAVLWVACFSSTSAYVVSQQRIESAVVQMESSAPKMDIHSAAPVVSKEREIIADETAASNLLSRVMFATLVGALMSLITFLNWPRKRQSKR